MRPPRAPAGPDRPLTVIGGFLGAGKTTFLNRLLARARGRYAVLVNDFGAVNVDAGLVAGHDGTTLRLTNGCVCCSMNDGFVDTLLRVLGEEPPFDAVVIEASGVGDPWAIAEIALVEPGLTLAGVIVLADAERIAALLRDERLGDTVARQVRAADLVVLNKLDLVDEAGREVARAALRAALRAARPGVRIVEAVDAGLPEGLIRIGRTARPPERPPERPGAEAARHEEQFQRFAYRRAGCFDPARLPAALAALPASLLRLKGACAVAGEAGPQLLQVVGRRWDLTPAPPALAGEWAIELVGIGKNLDEGRIACILDSARVATGAEAGGGHGMPLTKRTFVGAGLGTLTALAVDGLDARAQSGPGRALAVGVTQVPRHFNGAVQSGTATATVSTQVFASPLRFDDKWNPQPYLAESWEIAPDNLKVTLKLVRNAVFHDGRPVTSEDVAFTIGVIKANHPFQTMLEPVASVDTPDPHTVVINLARPHPALLLAMSPALMPILPKHVYGDGQEIKAHPANLRPIGCGPYRFVEYRQGETVQLEKFDRFFIPGRPKLDRIVFRIIPDGNSLVIAAERGEIGAIPFLTGVRDIERLSKAPAVTVSDRGFEGIGPLNWLAFNTRKAPLDDVRVRQALCYTANRDFMVSKLLAGVAKPAFSPIVSSSPFYEPGVEPYAHDLAKAERLLDAAGLKKGADGTRASFTIDYLPGEAEQQRNMAEYLRSAYKRVGVNLEVRAAPDFPTWAQRVSNFEFDLTMDLVFNWGDPVIGVARTYLTSNIRKGVIWSNTQQYSNAKVDALLAAAAVEPDAGKRGALYKEFQRIVVDDAPIFFVNTTPYRAAFSKGLTDLPTSIWGSLAPLDELRWA